MTAFSVRSGNLAHWAVVLALAVLAGIMIGTVMLALAQRDLAQAGPTLVGGAALFCFAALATSLIAFSHLRRLAVMGLSDSLTSLPNRRALHEHFPPSFTTGEEIGIALLNLDGFRLINDHHGHHVGDLAIREAARILREVCGSEVGIYRLGGDEFALALAGPLSGTLLEGHCRRVIERMAKPVALGDRRVLLGASIGLTTSVRGDMTSSSELLRRADVAMSVSKRAGKMRCTWYSPAFDQNREESRKLDDELRHALAAGEFALAYQPLVSSETHEVVAVECLLRWNRADGKVIGPNVFIPAAEESGFINAIGLWVLRQACRDALAWDGITLSVNISPAQLRNPEFPIQLGHILEETGFGPERLELEITETCLVLDPVVAERSLDVIRGFGVRIALDDFGTGYASIGFLRQFRFEKLKIDRSLVVQAGEDEGSRAMMLSSITVARAMKMGVTAEGVETEEQAAMVRAAGCDQIQGWLYFQALPATEIPRHLGRRITATPGAIAQLPRDTAAA